MSEQKARVFLTERKFQLSLLFEAQMLSQHFEWSTDRSGSGFVGKH